MQKKRETPASRLALAGVLAALGVGIMAVGGFIPLATFVCPMLCMLLAQIVHDRCGKRVAWAWYGAVAILSLLLSPDLEGAGVFLFLGYYPLIKPWLDKRKLGAVLKGLYFNVSVAVLYWILLSVLGVEEAGEKITENLGLLLAVLVITGNVTFFLLDFALGRLKQVLSRGKRT